VKVTLPTYTDGVCDEGTAKVKVTAPKALSLDNETAMLIVTLSKKGGTTLSTSRTLTSPDKYNSIGNGTAASPYLIYNALQLQSLATAVNAGNIMTDSCFRMESDIDLSGVCHKVDGTPENDVSWTTDRRIWGNRLSFNGTFDGNGHKIINLYINQTALDYQGLFGASGNSFNHQRADGIRLRLWKYNRRRYRRSKLRHNRGLRQLCHRECRRPEGGRDCSI
jgi:hypothetical protein